MSKSFNHADLMKLFGGSSSKDSEETTSQSAQQEDNKDASSKENNNVLDAGTMAGYRRSNYSLVIKNGMLQADTALTKKKVSDLMAENEKLREKIQILESKVDNDIIDYLVAERFQKKMNQLNKISERTADYLRKSAMDFRAVFDDMSTSVTNSVGNNQLRKGKLARLPSLANVEESPLVRDTVKPLENFNSPEDLENTLTESPKTISRAPSTASIDSGVTPVVGRRGRPPKAKSALNADQSDYHSAIPSTSFKTPVVNRSSAPTRGTPVTNEPDTVRRKRSAAAKITSLAEPKLGTKLRRPGKFDEPSPYIHDFC